MIKEYLDVTSIKTLPSNVEAEQMLLGAILINPDLFSQVIEFLKSEHFFEPLHQKIYYAIEAVCEKEMLLTPITLKSMLDHDQLFNKAGNIKYLGKLTTLAIMVINIKDYGQIIFDLSIKRQLIEIGKNIVNDAYSSLESSSKEQIEHAEVKLYNLISKGVIDRHFVSIGDSVSHSLKSINLAMKNLDHVIGISTGLIDLDFKLSGFHNSDVIIIAGRPSMGKTAFAINFAFNACASLKQRGGENSQSVGIFSLEMSSEQLIHRLLSMLTNIDSSNLRSGRISEEHYISLQKSALYLSSLPFFIDDTPSLSISALRTRARKLKRKHNLGILFIDYLQLIRGSHQNDNRVLEISEITQGLKTIAKELNIPIVALSQLSRAVEQRDDKKPMLSDLRESGSIEQDADVVMFLYREEYYLSRKEPPIDDMKRHEWQNKMEKSHNITEIIIAKHRNGPTGSVHVYYDTRFSKIGNLEKNSFK